MNNFELLYFYFAVLELKINLDTQVSSFFLFLYTNYEFLSWILKDMKVRVTL